MVEDYLNNIAETGILGTLLIISFVVIWILWKENEKKSKEISQGKNDRIADLKTTLNVNTTFMLEQKEVLKNIQALIEEGQK